VHFKATLSFLILRQHLQQATPELWKELCFRECRLTAVGRYSVDDVPQDPDSWRARCLLLKVVEEKLLEEARSKLRSKFMKAVENKKEREVKYTDRVPPPKRARTGWNTNVPAKTLFQKTRSDASKLQKNIYNARFLPPMPTAKNYGQVAAPQMALQPSSSSRVTVNTVIKTRPVIRSVTSDTTAQSSSSSSSATSPTIPQKPLITSSSSNPPTPTLMTVTVSESPPIAKSPSTNKSIKKDPMASLFVPKRKAYSQRPM